MSRKYTLLKLSVSLLFLWMLGSGLWLNTWLQGSEKVKFPGQGKAGYVRLEQETISLGEWEGKPITAQAGWTSFNKTYCSLKIDWSDRRVFEYAGTSSWTSEPGVWIRKLSSGSLPDILTFQPLVLDQPGLEEFHSGFHLWKFDGKSYRPSSMVFCPLNSLLRSPIPFQN